MMSNNLNVRLPARSVLDAKQGLEFDVPDELAKIILSHLGVNGRIKKLTSETLEIKGFYRLYINEYERSFFVKILPDSYLKQQMDADEFACLAKSKGINSSTVERQFVNILDNSLCILLYDWIEGTDLPATEGVMSNLGAQLGKLHLALEHYPYSDDVRIQSQHRLRNLRNIARKVIENNDPATRNIKWLQSLLESSPSVFSGFSEDCQVLHGDLNIGNVRWTKSGVCFLDFEDSKHSYFPRRIDVAFALERLLLINESNSESCLMKANCFLESYVDSHGTSPFMYRGALKESLKWLSIRSLCMLQSFEWQGDIWPESEWEKFKRLLDYISNNDELLLEIEHPYVGI